MAISTTASSPVRFVLKDDLKHPAYHWPLSRVRYPVSFDAGVKAEELCLVDEGSGQCVPFQLTEVQEREGLVRRAVVNLMSDLPSGGRREFRLDIKSGAATRPAGSDPCVGTPMALVDPVRVLRDPNGIVLDNGHVRVRIAGRGQTYGRPVDPSEAPAPVIRFGDDRGWYGRGQWAVEGQVLKVEVQEVSAGPLVAEFRITYSFDGDRRYSVVVRLTAQMEFVELDEEMSGFTKEQQASWRMITICRSSWITPRVARRPFRNACCNFANKHGCRRSSVTCISANRYGCICLPARVSAKFCGKSGCTLSCNAANIGLSQNYQRK